MSQLQFYLSISRPLDPLPHPSRSLETHSPERGKRRVSRTGNTKHSWGQESFKESTPQPSFLSSQVYTVQKSDWRILLCGSNQLFCFPVQWPQLDHSFTKHIETFPISIWCSFVKDKWTRITRHLRLSNYDQMQGMKQIKEKKDSLEETV